MNNEIQKIFNIEEDKTQEKPPVVITQPEKPVVEPDEVLESDFQVARDDFDEIMLKGKIALDTALTIAQQGQHPRFFEAVNMLLKTLSEANLARMESQLKLHQINKIKSDIGMAPTQTTKIDKAIFVGSTADLLKQVKPRDKVINQEPSKDGE